MDDQLLDTVEWRSTGTCVYYFLPKSSCIHTTIQQNIIMKVTKKQNEIQRKGNIYISVKLHVFHEVNKRRLGDGKLKTGY